MGFERMRDGWVGGVQRTLRRVLTVDDLRGRAPLQRLAFWHIVAPLLALPLTLRTVDTWTRPALVTVLVVAVLTGVITLLLLRRDLSDGHIRLLDHVVFWVDQGLLVTATAVAASSPLALLLIPTLATLRLGRKGAIVGMSLATFAELSRQLILVQVRGEPANPVRSAELLAFAGLVAGTITQLTSQLEQRRREAESDAAAARAGQIQMGSIHRIIMAGIGGSATSVVERVVQEVHEQYGYAGVSVALLEGDGLRFVQMAGSEHPDDIVPIDPGGPASRVLAGEDVVTATGDDLDGLVTGLPGLTTLIVAAVRGRSGLLGTLMLECDRPGPRPPGEPETVGRLAEQLGVLLEAARAFDREAALAEDYRKLDEMRRDFVSLTSHELRTPATAIVGFVETLLHRDIPDEATRRRLLEATSRQATRLTRLIDDLRTVSVLDAGGMRVAYDRASLDDIVATILEPFDGESGLVRQEGPAGVKLITDPSRLAQILTNLVENGLRHGAAPVTLAWDVADAELIVTVRDSGNGVPEERRERIFERFETTSDLLAHSRGSGLGLPIARELAERLGGTLVLTDEEGGAAFRLTMPLVPAAVGDGTLGVPA